MRKGRGVGIDVEEKEREIEQREENISKKEDEKRIKMLAGIKGRQRAGSMPDIEKWMIKRKRDEEEKGIETGDEELTAFKKSNIINRSPLKKEKEEGEGTGLILGEIRKLGEEERRDKVEVLDKLEGIRSEIEGIKKEMKWKEEGKRGIKGKKRERS